MTSKLSIAGVSNRVRRHKLLLDRSQRHKPAQQVSAASLVVRATGTRTTEGLLADNGSGALAVDVEVTGGVAEGVAGAGDDVAVLCEDGARQAVFAGVVDLLADAAVCAADLR